MNACVDWTKTLRRASFRGASFFVATDDIDYGRRIKTHEFPNRDRPFQEDLGEKAIEYNVTAYVASDAVLGEAAALVAACRQRGGGTLVLPVEGSLRVVCKSCKRQHAKDKLGYIAFTLHFGEEGSNVAIGSIPLLERLVALTVSQAAILVGSAFTAAFNTIGEVAWVAQSAANQLRTWVATVDDARLGITLAQPARYGLLTASSVAAQAQSVNAPLFTGAELARLLADTHDNAGALTLDGKGLPSTDGLTLSVNRGEPAGALAERVFEITAGLRLAAATPEEAIEALSNLIGYDPGTPDAGDGPSANAEDRNTALMASLFRRAALLEFATATAEADPRTRSETISLRAKIAEGFERELSLATGDVYAVLDDVRGAAAQALSAKLANKKPTIVVEANASLPSILWGWRLYGDAKRGDELAERNHVHHPSFMPNAFEADAE